ncbi:hypothetical protein Nizo2484_2729 [Lactiplantibacillus plantarum]|nr:hypothetical protein Nizo2484_2729 [Lactiplantibacillus plantarum]KZU29075.1 hypothetical protein Nizo2485_0412 [Lactiplantibacillus plantarum]
MARNPHLRNIGLHDDIAFVTTYCKLHNFISRGIERAHHPGKLFTKLLI